MLTVKIASQEGGGGTDWLRSHGRRVFLEKANLGITNLAEAGVALQIRNPSPWTLWTWTVTVLPLA